jgi:phosphoglycerate dehydrogenase-like enzyme
MYRVGIDRGFLDAEGKTRYADIGISPLRAAANVAVEFLDEYLTELGPAHIAAYQGMILGGVAVSRRTFAEGSFALIVLARHGVGYDRIDVDACTANDVALGTTPTASKHPVASASFAYIMALAKRLVDKDRLVRRGRWDLSGTYCGNEIEGKTLGIVGLGNTGGELTRLVAPFAMRVLAFDPYTPPEVAQRLGVTLTTLDEVMREADFVCVHAKLTPETRHLLGARELALLKPTAYFINCARGPIVDQRALTLVLQERRIAGAGLDVFEEEPLSVDDPLIQLDNVMLSPHTAAHTLELSIAMGNVNSAQMLAAARGEVPLHVVNAEVLERPGFRKKLEQSRTAPDHPSRR